MSLSVQARAPEIALRRAIGASRSDIARLFLCEGLIIGIISDITYVLVDPRIDFESRG